MGDIWGQAVPQMLEISLFLLINDFTLTLTEEVTWKFKIEQYSNEMTLIRRYRRLVSSSDTRC